MTSLPGPFGEAGTIVELAIGERHDLAIALRDRGCAVTATDVRPRALPDDIRFIRDDLHEPTVDHYRAADLLCARRLPEELQSPAVDLAERVNAPFLFTTLGFELPAVAVETVTEGSPTWYRATNPT